ncbi:MAG: hypothetical protein FWB86_12505 [Treponema sp.]|nr:hypothetical protein [Treponema sp.]MCL2252446.1 hypothetical protein [Treponema sp.]
MPWRLIIFIVIFAIFLVFVTFNLNNKCDISFGFTKLSEVPVFITIFSSFVLGFFCALPLIYHIRKRKTERQRGSSETYGSSEMYDSSETQNSPVSKKDKPKKGADSSDIIDPAEARKKFLSRKRAANGNDD